jgi:hypothetical protein
MELSLLCPELGSFSNCGGDIGITLPRFDAEREYSTDHRCTGLSGLIGKSRV